MTDSSKTSRPVAFVTGGTRGIGLGCAEKLADAGFDLALNGMREADQVETVMDQLRTRGAEVIYCRGDIGNAADRSAMLDAIKAHYGRLNVLVNNAGVAPKVRKDILEADEESFDYVVGTNLKGAYFLTQATARWMIEQKESNPGYTGSIINVSSISATIASIRRGEYCVAKAGLSMATQLFAVRLGEYNIPVYEVRPGVTKTDMTAGITEKYDKLIAEGLCITRRWGFPDDVGRAVAALAKGDFPYSTGQVIMVDGGLSIPRL
jgi:3-oxoacyl-[acyl-carrier protein] reductase